MKKVININFQGRVIPIEESAYDMLKQYVESLRKFFAKEEGRDEIINDIEGRIAELFVENLKKGSTCITDEHVDSIIVSMGRPEDFEGEETRVHSQLEGENYEEKGQRNTDPGYEAPPRGRLYRNDTDKILGGVCGGVASYLRVDPTIVRIVFALVAFVFGGGVLLYILLWAILPSKPLATTTTTKRLYRNPDEKVVAGVASGIASYFDIAVWIPRLIFSLPLVSVIIMSIVRNAFFFDDDFFPGIVFGSFGGTLFVIYAVLWAVIPEARSASEKLEMRGEKVDLHTIKNTIQEDLEGFKTRAEKWSGDVKERAQQFTAEFNQTMAQKGKQFGSEAGYAVRSGGSRLGRAIGIMFKAFFLFIAGILAFVMLMALVGLTTAGVGVFPLKDFFLNGVWQNFLAWTTLLLFLCVPVIALITWIIRRIMGVRSKSKYLGFTFGGLWVIGLIAGILLVTSIFRNFDAVARDEKSISIAQPATGKMIIRVADSRVKVTGRWLNMDGVVSINDDSLFLNNVRFRITKSKDSAYHMTEYTFSNGRDEGEALSNLKEINYRFNQQDSTIVLNRGFSIQKGTRFRNQAVALVIHVPIGKRIYVDRSVSRKLHWFHMSMGNRDWEWEDNWNNDNEYYWYSENTEYIMTTEGLKRVDEKGKKEKEEETNDAVEKYKQSKEDLQKEYDRKMKEAEDLKKELNKPVDSTKYQFKKETTSFVKPDAEKVKTVQDEEKPGLPDGVDLTEGLGIISILHSA